MVTTYDQQYTKFNSTQFVTTFFLHIKSAKLATDPKFIPTVIPTVALLRLFKSLLQKSKLCAILTPCKRGDSRVIIKEGATSQFTGDVIALMEDNMPPDQ